MYTYLPLGEDKMSVGMKGMMFSGVNRGVPTMSPKLNQDSLCLLRIPNRLPSQWRQYYSAPHTKEEHLNVIALFSYPRDTLTSRDVAGLREQYHNARYDIGGSLFLRCKQNCDGFQKVL